MDAIKPLWEQMPLQLRSIEPKKDETAEPLNFTDIFQTAVDAVRETDAERVDMEYLMATGQLDNPAPLLIAASKAQLSVDLLVQLRNKAMDAYNEIMRISL